LHCFRGCFRIPERLQGHYPEALLKAPQSLRIQLRSGLCHGDLLANEGADWCSGLRIPAHQVINGEERQRRSDPDLRI
jgi:hypothetical protein